jgi:hypothetical protein
MSDIPARLQRAVIRRATIAALDMNRPLILAIRREEALRGRHPAPNR